MVSTLMVGLGSAIGGMARYGCSLFLSRLLGETFPWGTLFVNVSGSFVIGLFFALTASGQPRLAHFCDRRPLRRLHDVFFVQLANLVSASRRGMDARQSERRRLAGFLPGGGLAGDGLRGGLEPTVLDRTLYATARRRLAAAQIHWRSGSLSTEEQK